MLLYTFIIREEKHPSAKMISIVYIFIFATNKFPSNKILLIHNFFSFKSRYRTKLHQISNF